MRFLHTASYDASPAEVYAMLTDQTFREKVCVAARSVHHQVSVEGTTVTIDQTQQVRQLPAFAAKLVGETITLHQVEHWTSPTSADLELTIPGKPGQLRGDITLRPNGAETTYTIDGELKVGIPLVGGKLEGLVEGLLKTFLTREHRTGQDWLSGS